MKKVARTNILKGTLVRITACSTVLWLGWYSVFNVKLWGEGGDESQLIFLGLASSDFVIKARVIVS